MMPSYSQDMRKKKCLHTWIKCVDFQELLLTGLKEPLFKLGVVSLHRVLVRDCKEEKNSAVNVRSDPVETYDIGLCFELTLRFEDISTRSSRCLGVCCRFQTQAGIYCLRIRLATSFLSPLSRNKLETSPILFQEKKANSISLICLASYVQPQATERHLKSF